MSTKKPSESDPDLRFKISSGLKSVLGRELITDEHVAIFELVKNSYDARASHVHVYIDRSKIVVLDNGNGMSLDDIRNKWLFVAYSSKRRVNRTAADYRSGIAERQQYAGSKGVGRFSTDRLGEIVILQTRSSAERTHVVHQVLVNWKEFDTDHLKTFDTIDVGHKSRSDFDLPSELPKIKHGTAVELRKLRHSWNRNELLALKASLAKLINPFGTDIDGFRVTMVAPHHALEDAQAKQLAKGAGDELPPNDFVNGDVGNFIFSTLKTKTTFLDVRIDGDEIESRLVDRGETVYRIREPNPYEALAESGFCCQLYFLNQSAKQTFARRMGVPSVQFGSVFVFRNGFRVHPIGDEGDDWFGIDRRKQQGYARYLGTRDIIGRIDVAGSDEDFQEASSRNDGLIKTPAVVELQRCFNKHCLQRLERYVVPVSWADKEDKNLADLSRLMTDPGRARVASAVASLVESSDVKLLEYSKRLIDVLNERSTDFSTSLESLRSIAKKAGDSALARRIDKAEERFREIARAEEEARKQAEVERQAKEDAQKRASDAEKEAGAAKEQLEEERKRNLFLTAASSLDMETIVNMHHQITIYSVDIQNQIESCLNRLSERDKISKEEVTSTLEQLAFLNKRILAISKLATRANFRLESEQITGDLGEYVSQYVSGVVRDYLISPMTVEVTTDGKGFKQTFKPIDVSIVVDNLISNAKKARASSVSFELTHPEKRVLHIRVVDDGRGIAKSVQPKSRVFERGFTTTDGSGLGLYHVRQVLGEIGGSIEIDESLKSGTAFLIRISA